MFLKLDNLYIKLDSINQIGPYDINFQNEYEAGIAINGQKYCLVRFTASKDCISQEELEAVADFTKKVTEEIIKLTGQETTDLILDGAPVVEKLREMLGEFRENHDTDGIEK